MTKDGRRLSTVTESEPLPGDGCAGLVDIAAAKCTLDAPDLERHISRHRNSLFNALHAKPKAAGRAR